jgi:hypothetical protein
MCICACMCAQFDIAKHMRMTATGTFQLRSAITKAVLDDTLGSCDYTLPRDNISAIASDP